MELFRLIVTAAFLPSGEPAAFVVRASVDAGALPVRVEIRAGDILVPLASEDADGELYQRLLVTRTLARQFHAGERPAGETTTAICIDGLARPAPPVGADLIVLRRAAPSEARCVADRYSAGSRDHRVLLDCLRRGDVPLGP